MKVRVSTDSTADITPAIREELSIAVVPLDIIHQGKEYRDGVDIPVEEFYQLLESCEEIPGTAQVPMERYTALFEETLAQGYTDLIHVSINAKGSGTYQAGIMARDLFFEDHPEARDRLNITILDSGNYSMGYGLGVIAGARLAQTGASGGEVLAEVEDWVAHGRVLFIPMNLRFVRKSGRVSAAAAFVGDALGLKPIITFQEGESRILSKVRGEVKAIAAMVDLCAAERRPGTACALAYGSNPGAFRILEEQADRALGSGERIRYPLGCVITINAGPNAVGICYRT